jgi:hypothetical protein
MVSHGLLIAPDLDAGVIDAFGTYTNETPPEPEDEQDCTPFPSEATISGNATGPGNATAPATEGSNVTDNASGPQEQATNTSTPPAGPTQAKATPFIEAAVLLCVASALARARSRRPR